MTIFLKLESAAMILISNSHHNAQSTLIIRCLNLQLHFQLHSAQLSGICNLRFYFIFFFLSEIVVKLLLANGAPSLANPFQHG
jgi:hypothetical protein